MHHDYKAARLTPPSGFVNNYSTTAVEEDKAEVFANMIVRPQSIAEWAKVDGVIRNKARMMRDPAYLISNDIDDAFWEALPCERRSHRLARSFIWGACTYAVIAGIRWLLGRARRRHLSGSPQAA